MKKIIAMALAATCTMAASALDVKLFHGDKELQNGAEYNVGYVQTEMVPGLPMYRTVWDADLFIQADPNLKLNVYMTADLAGAQICGIDGQCVYTTKNEETIKKTGSTSTSAPESLMIEYIVAPGQSLPTETNQILVEVSLPSDPTDCFSVIINMVPKTQEEVDGVIEITAEDLNAPVKYYNIEGVEMPVSNLVPGNIYVRRQGANTQKILVK